ncbi:MAG TPA: condensation domain-containing protein, partial [Candidatus Limnocylindrales bacterium]
MPLGVSGELSIGGDCVARGYLGRPALTAAKFVPDACAGIPGARLYRSGDLVRRRHDGELDFLGRWDSQVKIRGYRVEPAEVEATIDRHPTVRESAVLAREDERGEPSLVAYLVAGAEPVPPLGELHLFLADRLPRHMLPAAIVCVAEFPRTAGGKVDRRRLGELAPAPGVGPAARCLGSPLTEIVAGVWREVLGIEAVGEDDDFFALGGHSLQATRVAARLRQVLGVEMPLRRLFDAPRLKDLASAVARARRAEEGEPEPPLLRLGPSGERPVSFAQRRLWLVDQLDPGNPSYNVPSALLIEGLLHPPLLVRALGEVARRHEVLRTVFHADGGEPRPIVLPWAPLTVPVIDLGGVAGAGEAEPDLVEREARLGFDLGRGPLLRARLLRLADRRHVLLLTMHHIVSDGWSISILVRETCALYRAFGNGASPPLAALPIQYQDFAAWQRRWFDGEREQAQRRYWRRQFGGQLLPLRLPDGRSQPAVSDRGASLAFALPPALSVAVRSAAGLHGCTLFMLLLAALQAVLHRRTGQQQVVVGTEIANRHRVEVEGLIGFFVNILLLKTDLGGDPTLAELLDRVRSVTLDAYDNQDFPFDLLLQELQPQREELRLSIPQVVLVHENAPTEELRLPDLSFESIGRRNDRSKFDLLLVSTDRGESVAGTWRYRLDLFEAAFVQQLHRDFEALLAVMVADPQRRLGVLELPSD